MPERASDRYRQRGRQTSPSQLRRTGNPVLALQRSIGNRAVGAVLAREPARTATVEIPGVGKIKVKGGNLGEWAGTGVLDTVEVTSQKGKHSAKLEKHANARTRTDVTVMIAPATEAGEHLNVGGGIRLEIKDARVTGYSLQDGVETWRLSGFENVKRTKITHTIGAGE